MVDLIGNRSTCKLKAQTSVMNVKVNNFNMWSEKVVTAMNSLCPDVVRSEEGGEQPVGEGAATWDFAKKITIKAGEEAIMILRKYRGWTRERASDSLGKKYYFKSDQAIRYLWWTSCGVSKGRSVMIPRVLIPRRAVAYRSRGACSKHVIYNYIPSLN